MTNNDFYNQIRESVRSHIKEFPFVILNDPYRIVNDEVLKDMGLRIVNYREENDYANARLNFEMAKSFCAEPTIFVFQHESADEYFSDLRVWFDWIDADKSALEYISKTVGQDIPEPLTPLIVFILKNELTIQLKSMWKEATPKEVSLDFLTNFLLSVIVGYDIYSVENDSEKVKKLFGVVFCSEKIERARDLLNFKEGRDFVEEAFSLNKLVYRSLIDEEFREKLCSTIMGTYFSMKFEDAKKEIILSILFERFGFGGREERNELKELFEIVKDILASLFLNSFEQRILTNVDSFVRDNEKLWFEGNSLDNSSSILSTHLSSEFDWISRQIRETLKKLPSSVTKIEETVGNLKSWTVVKNEKPFQDRIKNFDASLSLLKTLNSFPRNVPQTWEEWCGAYEHIILQGDKILQNVVQEPSLLSDEAWQHISIEYEKVRNKFVDEYEQFLKSKYPDWIKGNWPKPVMSWEVVDYYLRDITKKYDIIFIVLCDGMRWDFWNILKQNLIDEFQINEEKICSLVPSTTSFSRRAIFSGVLPEDFEDVSEENVLKKALGENTTWTIGSKIDFKDLLELSESTEKIRIFVYRTAEILHEYRQSLTSALGGFESASREFSKNLKHVVKKADKSIVVIISDHGFTEVSEQLKIPDDLHRKAKRKFAIEPDTARCWIVGEKPNEHVKMRDIEDFKEKIKNKFGDGVFMFNPSDLALTRKNDTIVIHGQVILRPFLVIIPRNFRYVSTKGLPFTHGGLTPYETIVPFATLIPK